MNVPNKTNGSNCTAAQDLLIKKDVEPLTDEENFSLTEHLQNCARCVAFQSTLRHIHQLVETTAQDGLQPDPAIRQRLRDKIGLQKPPSLSIASVSGLWHSILGILRFRIPIYQAALGVAAVVAIFMAIEKLNARGDGVTLKPAQITPSEKQMIAPSPIMNTIAKIDSQKIGRTVADDSLLMKFIVTVSGENI